MHKRVRYLSTLFQRADGSARLHLFQALVFPLFNFCSVVRYSSPKLPMEDLEKFVPKI